MRLFFSGHGWLARPDRAWYRTGMKNRPVTIAIHYESYGAQWREMLADGLPGYEIRLWPDWGDLATIDYAIAWTPPHGLLQK